MTVEGKGELRSEKLEEIADTCKELKGKSFLTNHKRS